MPDLPRIPGLSVQGLPPRRIAELFESTKWGDDLSAKEVETLARYVHPCTLEKGATLVREGEKEAFLALLVTGKLDVLKGGVLLQTVLPGRTIGEMSIIDGEPRSASAVAVDACSLLLLTAEGFQRMIDEVPRLAVRVVMKIAKLTSQRLRMASGRLLER